MALLALTWAGILMWGLLIVSVMLLILGWRGRRLGDHPHCRKCEFNLTGLPDDKTSCPECGANLRHPRAKVSGQRVRRKWMMAIAPLLLLVVGGLIAYPRLDINYYQYAPDLLLVRMLGSDQAREEVVARISNGRLSNSLAIDAANQALSVQGDLSQTWSNSWGLIIEEAASAKLLSAEQMLRYAEQAGIFELKIRSRIQAGRNATSYAGCRINKRLGRNTLIHVKLRATQFTVNDRNVPLNQYHRDQLARWEWKVNGFSGGVDHLPVQTADASSDVLSMQLQVEPVYTIQTGNWTSTAYKGAARTLTATIEIVDHPTGNYTDPDTVPVEDRAANAWVWLREHPRSNQVNLCFGARQSDLLLMPKVWLRTDGPYVDATNWIISRSRGGAGGEYRLMMITINMERVRKHFPGATHVDLIARTNIQTAETEATNQDKPRWLGEWAFRNVPLGAEAQTVTIGYGSNVPKSLVPAEARNLTFEEAEQPPVAPTSDRH